MARTPREHITTGDNTRNPAKEISSVDNQSTTRPLSTVSKLSRPCARAITELGGPPDKAYHACSAAATARAKTTGKDLVLEAVVLAGLERDADGSRHS